MYDGIFEFTDGVPRRINTLMDRLLLYGYLEQLHEITREGLTSVANDIIEEQGGPGDSESITLPTVEVSPQIESDALEVQPHATTTRPTSKPSVEDSRLAPVEQSMTDLTGAVREELALLRKALLNQKDPNEDKR